jgi:hypothetical protein
MAIMLVRYFVDNSRCPYKDYNLAWTTGSKNTINGQYFEYEHTTSMGLCQLLCLVETRFDCRSVEYEIAAKKCRLSLLRKADLPPDSPVSMNISNATSVVYTEWICTGGLTVDVKYKK